MCEKMINKEIDIEINDRGRKRRIGIGKEKIEIKFGYLILENKMVEEKVKGKLVESNVVMMGIEMVMGKKDIRMEK